MLKELLLNCKTILKDEHNDYAKVVERIPNDAVVTFFPLCWTDLWPLYVLECTDASRYKSENNIYIAPIGAHDFYADHILKQIIEKFYHYDEIDPNRLYYRTSLEEMILLQNDKIPHNIYIDKIGNVNVVYLNLRMKNDNEVHLFLIADTHDNVWKNIIEKYNIKTDFIIDSHKGLDDYFTRIPLYEIMKNTSKRNLLPQYYFKGKFSKDDAPCGFELVHIVSMHEPGESKSEIYLTKW